MYQAETTTADTYANVAIASDSTESLSIDGKDGTEDLTKYSVTDDWILTSDELMKRKFGSNNNALVEKEKNATLWNELHSNGFHLGGVKVVPGKRSSADKEGTVILDNNGKPVTSLRNKDNASDVELDPSVVNTVYMFIERNYYDVNFHANDNVNGDGSISSTTAHFVNKK